MKIQQLMNIIKLVKNKSYYKWLIQNRSDNIHYIDLIN